VLIPSMHPAAGRASSWHDNSQTYPAAWTNNVTSRDRERHPCQYRGRVWS